jgi:hypothetical protein
MNAEGGDADSLGEFGTERMVGRPGGLGCILLVQKEGEDDPKGFGLPRFPE